MSSHEDETPESTPELDDVRDMIDFGDFANAIHRLDGLATAPRDDRERGRVMALRIICQQRSGHFQEVEDEARSAIRDDGQNRIFLLGASAEFAEMGEYPLAEELLRELVHLDPEDHEAMFLLATVIDRDGRLEEASRLYDDAIALEPDFAPNYNHKAGCLRDLEQYEQSIVAYRHYLKLEPEDAFEWVSLALVCSDRELFDEAYAAFEQARVLEPESPSLYYHWAITAVQRHDRCSLSKCLDTLNRHVPHDWRTCATRALLHEYDRDIQGGWIASRRGIDLADREEDFESLLGAIGATLRYASRHRLTTQAADLVDRCFAEELLDDDVLDAMRLLDDEWSKAACDFEVVVDSAVDAEVVSHIETDLSRDPRGYRYVRHYQIFARSEEHAAELAMHFESRLGANDLLIQEIEQVSSGFEERLGVVSRSNGYFMYIDPNPEPDERNDDAWDDGDESGQSNGLFFPRF